MPRDSKGGVTKRRGRVDIGERKHEVVMDSGRLSAGDSSVLIQIKDKNLDLLYQW